MVSSTFRFAAQRGASRGDRRQLARGCGVPAIDRAAHGAHVLQSPRKASLSAVTTPATSKQAERTAGAGAGAAARLLSARVKEVIQRPSTSDAYRLTSARLAGIRLPPFYTAEPPCTAGA